MTMANISSTSIYINWTLLPISTDDYMQLLGYKMSYWKESEESKEFNMTFPPNVSEILFENLEKWTVYCFRIAGFTMADSGPNGTECFRTSEDGMLKLLPTPNIIFDMTIGSGSIWIIPKRNVMSLR